MLTTETRQGLQSLVNHKCISSVSVNDYRGFNGSIDSSVTIHAVVDIDRATVLHLLDSLVDCTTRESEAQEPRNGVQAFPYQLSIAGSVNYMSYLYFSETEKAPLLEGAEEIVTLDDTPDWSAEQILRNAG